MQKPIVSVVVPVYNDPDRVKICLKALENQSYPEDLYEVVLVDNNSRYKPDVTENDFPHLVFTIEETPGPSAARNKGILTSRGEVIAFTDADCIPDENWIEKGVNFLLKNPHIGIIGGRVEVFPENDNNPNSLELWEMVSAYPQKFYIERNKFAATANVFTYRKAIEKAGLFDVKLLYYGEDREWTNRIYNSGFGFGYAHDVLVRHPARRTFKEFYRKWYRYLYGEYILERLKPNFKLSYIKTILINLIPPVLSLQRIASDDKFKQINGKKNKFKALWGYILERYIKVYLQLILLFSIDPDI